MKDHRAGFMLASSNRLSWAVEPSSRTYAKFALRVAPLTSDPSYGTLANLLNTVGGILQPKGCCAQVFAGQSG